MKKLTIYLSDFANELYEIDNKSIPIGVGYVGAYCKSKFGTQVSVRIFRTFEPFWEAVKKCPPDIAGFGSYDWNHNLTLAAINKTKVINPNCAVVFGGANVEIQPEKNKEFLKENTNVDFLVYGDGEFPFARIVEGMLENLGSDKPIALVKGIAIDGVRSLLNDNLIMGKDIDPVMDMDEIPSPYLWGLFDELLENKNLMPILQNIRGCPYSCRFCVSGTQFGRIRHFSFDRVTKEIEYLRKNAKNRFLRFSDDNFGVIKHDVRIAEYIRDSFDQHNYPAGLKAYSAKKQNDRTRLVARILKPLMTYVISFQTTTPQVLKETKRISATYDEAVKSLAYARQHGLSTGTELIFGLPGETLTSWKEVINTTLGLRFDSVSMNPLWLLKGSELNRNEVREKNQYRGKFMMAENAVTKFDDFFSMERDEIAVQSKYYSYEDWKVFLQYEILVNILMYHGYGRELINYALCIGITPTELFDRMLKDPETFPVVHELVTSYVHIYTQHLFDSEQDLKNSVLDFIDQNPGDREGIVALGKSRIHFSYLVKYFFDDSENQLLREIQNAARQCHSGKIEHQVEEELDCVLELALKLLINPRCQFEPVVDFESIYDVGQWIREGYSQTLSTYRLAEKKRFTLASRNQVTVAATIQRDKEEGRTDCFYFFRYMNSGLMRRVVQEDYEGLKYEGVPVEPYIREHRTIGTSPTPH